MTKALLIIAHGSRNSKSNQEIENLVEAIKDQCSDFDQIQHSFLELSEPTISQALQKLVREGAACIKILPYFLAAGKHVEKDIPLIVAEAVQSCPNIQISLLPHIGSHSGQIQLILDAAQSH